MWKSKGKVAVVGVGMSKLVRYLERPLGPVVLETCLAAIEDAGLQPSDIDGISCLPYEGEGAVRVDGVHKVTPDYVMHHLSPKADIKWYTTLTVHPNFPISVIEAVNALAAGACDYALVFYGSRHTREARRSVRGVRFRDGAEGDSQFLIPYGAASTYQYHAFQYRRYMARYGATREHMARLAVSQRRNANLNEHAVFYDKPLSVEEYMDSRMIADPLCLFDCDMPVSGAAAVVLTTQDRARDLRHPPAYVAGYGENTARKKTGIVYQIENYLDNNAMDNIWAMSGLNPSDVDVAQLYDGFSPSVMYWLEAAGLCKEGEGYQMIESGAIEMGGSLPVNTSGGQLSEGAMGLGKLNEAVLQVTGRAGRRQVKDAHVSLVTEGSPMQKGAGILFTDEP